MLAWNQAVWVPPCVISQPLNVCPMGLDFLLQESHIKHWSRVKGLEFKLHQAMTLAQEVCTYVSTSSLSRIDLTPGTPSHGCYECLKTRKINNEISHCWAYCYSGLNLWFLS